MRLYLTLLVIFIAFTGCQTPAPAVVADNSPVTLKIYHTNDIHAHFSPDPSGRGGLAYLAGVLREVRQRDKDALILDAGDFYKKGSLPAQKSHDEATVEVRRHMPFYDARAVGNNEIKVGIPNLLKWTAAEGTTPLLSANFVDKNGKAVFPTHVILNKNGLKIGIIGVTPFVPVESDVQADPATDPRAPYKILKPEPIVAALIGELRPQVDVLILLSHQEFGENLRWAKAYPQVDLIVSGHSHILTPDQHTSGSNMVVEAGEFGQQVGVVTLVYDPKVKKVVSLDSTFWKIGPDIQKPDVEVQEVITAAYKKWAPEAFDKLAEVSGSLSIIDGKHPYEGSLPDWVADTFCEAAHCDIAFVNFQMVREKISKGIVTKEALYLGVPYEDDLAVVEMKKGRLMEMLNGSIERYFNAFHLVGYGFSKAKVKMILHGDQLKKVFILPKSPKENLKVALPLYLVKHCEDFFTQSQCPFPVSTSIGSVRPILQSRLLELKRFSPPEPNRVIIEEDTP